MVNLSILSKNFFFSKRCLWLFFFFDKFFLKFTVNCELLFIHSLDTHIMFKNVPYDFFGLFKFTVHQHFIELDFHDVTTVREFVTFTVIIQRIVRHDFLVTVHEKFDRYFMRINFDKNQPCDKQKSRISLPPKTLPSWWRNFIFYIVYHNRIISQADTYL